jgi:adenine-specific DNA-methyltransferase
MEARLIVEADGGQHSPESDRARTAFLSAEGFRILRFWNNDVLTNMDGVLQAILNALGGPKEEDPHPNLLPRAGEGARRCPSSPSPARGRG